MSSPEIVSAQSLNTFGTNGAAVVPKSRISIDTGLRDYASPSDSERGAKTAAELIPAVVKDFLQQVAAMDATSGENSPEVKPQPKPLRIILSETASRHLDATGEHAFVVVARGSYPDSAGRWVIHLVPATIAQVDAAVRVARGVSAERRIKTNDRARP